MKNKTLENILLDDNGLDDRLQILDNGMTKYGCKVYPYNHISYSSCTASTIRKEAFIHIQDYYNHLNLSKFDYITELDNCRKDLKNILNLEENIEIYFAYSGTHLELIPYLFIPQHSKVNNIIIAPNEVGSGTTLAASGKVFSKINNAKLKKGDLLEDFDKYNIKLFNIDIRDNKGNIESDEKLIHKIKSIVNNSNNYNILHLVFHSKTGLIKPNPIEIINFIKYCKNKNIILVIDACQFRLNKKTINKFLDLGFIVFITGSKFFSAPTFSAAALIPKKLIIRSIPKGINIYFGKEMFSENARKYLNILDYHNSLGLLLRWKSALYEMKLFFNIEESKIINTVTLFKDIVENMSLYYGYKNYYEPLQNYSYDELMKYSIFTFKIDNKLDISSSKKIYSYLISNNFLNSKFIYPVHLGQPVKIEKKDNIWLNNLRIALGSPFFVNYSSKLNDIQKNLLENELDYIFSFIEYIKTYEFNKK